MQDYPRPYRRETPDPDAPPPPITLEYLNDHRIERFPVENIEYVADLARFGWAVAAMIINRAKQHPAVVNNEMPNSVQVELKFNVKPINRHPRTGEPLPSNCIDTEAVIVPCSPDGSPNDDDCLPLFNRPGVVRSVHVPCEFGGGG